MVVLLSCVITAGLLVDIAAVTEQFPPAHGTAHFCFVQITVLGDTQQFRHGCFWDQFEHVPEHHKEQDNSEGSAQTIIAIIRATGQQHHNVREGKGGGDWSENPHQDLVCRPSPVLPVFVAVALGRRTEGASDHGGMEAACGCSLF
ncbi:hypothetical protein PG996_012208 [Apiospora saccharicola]|uniref:Secreted protein n=1 Tax=Apiospora saccharicola TaxID=335842 RepID=A0ABR1U1Y8_9PEZI